MGTGDGWTAKLALDESRVFSAESDRFDETEPVPKRRLDDASLSSTLDSLAREREATPTVERPGASRRLVSTPRVGAAMVRRRGPSARSLIIAVVIALFGSALYLAWYFGWITRFLGAG
jgi:hypothetical protein